MSTITTASAADLAAITRAFDALVPLNRAMGMILAEVDAGRSVIRLPWDERWLGDAACGLVHGGVLSVLLDAACGLAAFMGLREPSLIATLDLRIDHLRPAEAGQELIATAHIVRSARQVLFVRGFAHHGDESAPIAAATGTFAVTS
jgi:uncharacterized protein (TIGR00369 family)